jgi:hypothetical protein
MSVLIVLVAGVAACAVIVFIVLKDIPRVLRLARHGKRTTGKIVRDHTIMVKGGLVHFPVVHFKDDFGFIHEFQSHYQKKSSMRDHMSDVVVAYDPKNPTVAEVLEARHFYPSIIQVLVFLALAAGIPAFLLFSAK